MTMMKFKTEAATRTEFIRLVETDLANRGIPATSENLTDELPDYAAEYEDEFGIDPETLPE